MPAGVVFLIVVPTANFERDLYGYKQKGGITPPIGTIQPPDNLANNLNLNVQESNALLKLEVELRDKNAGRYGRGVPKRKPGLQPAQNIEVDVVVPMEKVLQELLTKLDIEQVTWYNDKKGCYFHVVFPIPAGEPCETTLHCLTELGFGKKFNSSVNVLPCSVCYDALSDPNADKEGSDNESEDLIKWNNFVESIKSKLTVKQVVDGVRGGGALSFDYILLIVTADSLAALGLIENNAPNITAAMLVSPLMGPVMSITFGTIISDKDLVKVGFISLTLGMFISLLFGFVFGLIVGTTEMPWGFNDWPTEEMRGRGNARSLWMGILWALTSGTGVAVALLQGSAGPLIGVAISASLLPPVVNCGLFWALACIWLIYPGIKIPHLKGEEYTGNSSYPFIYTDYLPTEFLINGIVSGLLTVINVICIFITAIIVLKIKEVSAPYTASPDVKRFWETDLRTVRKSNRSTIRKKGGREDGIQYEGLLEPRNRQLETVFEQAIKEATSDPTFNKVKRMSYSSNAGGDLSNRLQVISENRSENQPTIEEPANVQDTKANADLQTLDKLISSLLLERSNLAEEEQPLNRWKRMSRSFSSRSFRKSRKKTPLNYLDIEHTSLMPTILENNQTGRSKPLRVETMPLVDYKNEKSSE